MHEQSYVLAIARRRRHSLSPSVRIVPLFTPLAHFLSLKVRCEAPAGVATVWQVRVRHYRRGCFDPLSNFVLNDNPLHLVQLSCRFWFS